MSPITPQTKLSKPSPSTATGPAVEDAVAPSDAVLSARHLNVWYGTSLALRDVTIAIPRNKITALIGPSGCGKSTLLRCFNRMNDLIPGARAQGDVHFDGKNIAESGTDPVALRRRIGM